MKGLVKSIAAAVYYSLVTSLISYYAHAHLFFKQFSCALYCAIQANNNSIVLITSL